MPFHKGDAFERVINCAEPDASARTNPKRLCCILAQPKRPFWSDSNVDDGFLALMRYAHVPVADFQNRGSSG